MSTVTPPQVHGFAERLRALDAKFSSLEVAVGQIGDQFSRLLSSSPPEGNDLKHAVEIALDENTQLHNCVEELCGELGLVDATWQDADGFRHLLDRLAQSIASCRELDRRRQFASELRCLLEQARISYPKSRVREALEAARRDAVAELQALSDEALARLPSAEPAEPWLRSYAMLSEPEREMVRSSLQEMLPSLVDLLLECEHLAWVEAPCQTQPIESNSEPSSQVSRVDSPSKVENAPLTVTQVALGAVAPPQREAESLLEAYVEKTVHTLEPADMELPDSDGAEVATIDAPCLADASCPVDAPESTTLNSPPAAVETEVASAPSIEPTIAIARTPPRPADNAAIIDASARGDYLAALLVAAAACLDGEGADGEHDRQVRFDALVLAHQAHQRQRVELPSWTLAPECVRAAAAPWPQFVFLSVLRSASDSPYLPQHISAAEEEYLGGFNDIPDVAQWLREAWEAAKRPGLWEQVITMRADAGKISREAVDRFCNEYDLNLTSKARAAYARRQKNFMCRSEHLTALYRGLKAKKFPAELGNTDQPLWRYMKSSPESLVDDWIRSTGSVNRVSLTDYQRVEVVSKTEEFLQLARDALHAACALRDHVPRDHEEVGQTRKQLHKLRPAASEASRPAAWRHLLEDVMEIACPRKS